MLKNWEGQQLSEKEIEARELFDRVVKKREKDPETVRRMQTLWTELSFATLEKSDAELFDVQEVPVDLPAYAPIFDNATCAKCGETFMETHAVLVDGRPHCISCGGADYYMVVGKGIRPVPGGGR